MTIWKTKLEENSGILKIPLYALHKGPKRQKICRILPPNRKSLKNEMVYPAISCYPILKQSGQQNVKNSLDGEQADLRLVPLSLMFLSYSSNQHQTMTRDTSYTSRTKRLTVRTFFLKEMEAVSCHLRVCHKPFDKYLSKSFVELVVKYQASKKPAFL